MLRSNFQHIGPVDFPEWQGRQLHMHPLYTFNPVMPTGYEDYLIMVRNLLLRAAHSGGRVYLTVDEKIIMPGQSQRRPGAHVDGTWIPDLSLMPRVIFPKKKPERILPSQPPRNRLPKNKRVPREEEDDDEPMPMVVDIHRMPSGHGQPARRRAPPSSGGHSHGSHSLGAYVKPQDIIVAASVAGCRVYPGTFHGDPRSNGDLEHIRPQLGEGLIAEGGEAYILNPDCVHESLVFTVPTKRSFMRLALET